MPAILAVDDEYQIRRLVRETLEQAGYHVTEARDGKEALQQYRLALADLVVYGHSPAQSGWPGGHRRVATGIPRRKSHCEYRRQ